MTPEYFDSWNEEKKTLDEIDSFMITEKWTKTPRILFSEGEIWWCSLGKNIWREMYGKWDQFSRPVYILKKISGDMCVIIPLTSQEKIGTWFHNLETTHGKQTFILPQVRLISTNRLLSRMTEIPEPEQDKIKRRFLAFFS
jgi:mRNA-degrading endonuclease toxin of MazEF toxin-antitoxin module